MVDAIIFDDDALFGKLMTDYLASKNLRVKYYPDGERALERIHEDHPTVVLVDVMMPGLDGISICKQVKDDSKLENTKVVVVTGKGYTEDKTRALWAKADLFVEKPMNFPRFSTDLDGLLAKRPRADALRILKPDAGPAVAATVWNGALIALDAGRGLAELAADRTLLASVKDAWLLLSHFHKDHISGLTSAVELARAGLKLHIIGPKDLDVQLPQVIRRAFSATASSQALLSTVQFYQLGEGSYQMLPGVRLNTIHSMHPGPCLAFRLEGDGRKLVFAPDSELGSEDYDRKMAEFAKDADLFVHDARYSESDYERFARKGHSSANAAARVAGAAGAKKLLLHHIDGSYNELQVIALKNGAAAKGDVELALEENGLAVDF